MTEVRTEEGARCPTCGVPLTIDEGFTRWCASCEWNVDPGGASQRSRLARLFEREGDKAVERLYQQVRSRPPGRRAGRPLAAVVTVLAVLVHAVTIALLGGAVVIGAIVPGIPLVLRIIVVILLVGAAVAVQPFRRRKTGDATIDRADAPTLYDLLDEVAASVGCRPIDSVCLFAGFNAYFTKNRRTGRQLGIGLSLWTVLDGQARSPSSGTSWATPSMATFAAPG